MTSTLKNLHIRNCGISARGTQWALHCLPKYKSRLKVLNCSYNDLTGIDGKCLAQLNLSALYLQKTRLCDKELASLCANSMGTLRHLDLQFNNFQTDTRLSNLTKLVQANPCLVTSTEWKSEDYKCAYSQVHTYTNAQNSATKYKLILSLARSIKETRCNK